MYPIVTRARARRLSVLDTDSRPGTPQLDLAPERGAASPRPTRRTRLNSSTIDPHTPIRATRASVARGETPDPSTPVSVKRTTRTPAKATRSVKKQLTLKEETAEEAEDRVDNTTPAETNQQNQTALTEEDVPSMEPTNEIYSKKLDTKTIQENQTAFTENDAPLMESPNEKLPKNTSENKNLALKNVASEGNDSVFIASNEKRFDSPDLMEVGDSRNEKETNNVEETNSSTIDPRSPIVATTASVARGETPDPSTPGSTRTPAKATRSIKKQLTLKEETAEEAEDGVDNTTPTETNQTALTGENVPSMEPTNEILQKNQTPLREHVSLMQSPNEVSEANDSVFIASNEKSFDGPDLMEVDDSCNEKETNNEHVSLKESPKEIVPKSTSENKNHSLKNVASEANDSVFIASNEKSFDSLDLMEVDDSCDEKETNNVEVDRASAPVVTDIKRLSNLSPGIMSRIVRSPKEEKKKSVGFLSNNDGTESEKMRFPKTPGRDKPLIYTTPTLKHETPLKSSILCKGRTSSTPLNKYESGDSEIKLAPLEIDAIKSLDQLNAETSTMETIVNAKVAKQPFDFIDNEDDEESLKCEFFDDQAVDAGADYKSGDSMDSSERREINENQISSHGESVGSQDTEETSTENDDEDDSFIVSDYDSDEEKVNALRFSEEEDNFDVETDVKLNLKGSKKRRRIVEPQYSSEEERVELALEQKKIKPNNRRNCSSDTSKLSDAAQSMNGEKSGAETSEAELEASRQMALQALNNSEHLNRTVPRLDATVVDIVSSSDSDSEEKKKRASISIHEVIEPKKEETTTQKSGKSLADEEAALLDRLASNDLRHLADMFNPLQKSRRQSLYTASPELKTKELKLKRRSDRGLGTADEFHPSQSFVELVREQHQNHLERKRKHFSKSFSDFSKDLDDREVCHGPKRLKSSHDTEGQMPLVENTDNEEIPKSSYKKSSSSKYDCPAADAENEEIPKNSYKKASPIENTCDKPVGRSDMKLYSKEVVPQDSMQPKHTPNHDGQPCTSQDALMAPQNCASAGKNMEPAKPAKSMDYYMECCESILQAANKAVFNKKKRITERNVRHEADVALKIGKPYNKALASKPAAAVLPKTLSKKQAPAPKKDVKRLKTTRKGPGSRNCSEMIINPFYFPQPNARSLSQKLKKHSKTKQISSDEENRGRKVTYFRNNAGLVTVQEGTPIKSNIELIQTKAGIICVEPVTPKQKYFQVLDASPKNFRGGFKQETAVGSSNTKYKGSKHASQQPANSAQQSALRFKERFFTH
ncbi:hypothetical protein KR018_004587 [Drosophila ironensis]|nr:hypothetical protein KR018_004587 [Drosophila ironensis]